MAPRGGRGNFRGGLRGRGGRGRGRGRGRGASHAPVKRGPRFDTGRLDEDEQSSENESVNRPEDEAISSQDESADYDDEEEEEEEDDQEKVPAKPYMALIQSFTESSSPQAKRRKLDPHGSGERATVQAKAQETKGGAKDADENENEENVDREREGKDPDLIDEPEEAEGDAVSEDGIDNDDEEEQTDSLDPFQAHFQEPDEETASRRIKAIQQGKWITKWFATKGTRTAVMMPQSGDDTAVSLPPSVSGLNDLMLKQKLSNAMGSTRPKFDATEQAVASVMFQYYDMLYCNRTVSNAESLRRLACIHVLNHTFKTRDRVIKNGAKLARENANPDLELRDQGFTRPKVLFLLPTRNACAKVVDMICSLWPMEQQENKKRFQDSFVDKEAKFTEDRPADFRDLFEGNDDDMFRIGVKFTRKTIKYFSQFYNSDILFASPLGLRMAMGSDEEKDKTKKLDFDFLSSIEMVVVDQADALLMQNWEHVEYIFEHLNLQPKDAHDCDFGRVRNWYLEDQAKYFRQTIILSAFNTPELSELFRTSCLNWAGKVRIQPEYPGMIQQLGIKARQMFSRFDCRSIGAEPDARFAYFTSAVVPHLVKHAKDSSGTLIFIPSYLDFVRVRNYFATSPAVSNLSFATISEYADVPEASRARSHFLSGRHKVLLYTERAHHFRRYKLKGVQRVIMYGLPDNPIFYREIAGGYMAQSELDGRLEPGRGTMRAMFSKYDVLKLERIVGSQRVGKMIQERGDTFDFV